MKPLLSRKDSNLNSLDQNQMCCRYTTGQFIVGVVGLEPTNSKRLDLQSSAVAAVPYSHFARPKGLEPLTPGFGDQYSTN